MPDLSFIYCRKGGLIRGLFNNDWYIPNPLNPHLSYNDWYKVTFGVKGLSGDYCIHMIKKGDLWCEGTLSEWGLLYTHHKEGLPLV
jgi:hypothetical protein